MIEVQVFEGDGVPLENGSKVNPPSEELTHFISIQEAAEHFRAALSKNMMGDLIKIVDASSEAMKL